MPRLYTAAGESLPEIPWNDYPRPQLRRDDWLCLNGRWELSFGGRTGEILVPFCPESLLSGVEEAPKCGETMTYRRRFTVPETWAGRRVLLHFGAVSREAEVFVNGVSAATHDNGYLPFEVDITNELRAGENELAVRVRNDLDPRFPWGKQKARRGGMWYTPVSGIWQTVWLEPVPERRIQRLSVKIEGDTARITVFGAAEGTVWFEGRALPLTDGQVELTPAEPVRWTPDDPRLYWFTIISGEDRVDSYFALRTLSVEPDAKGLPRLCLNGKPFFFHGLLDQGYWSDGLYTPAAPELFAEDILAMKELGFNTLRKHIKLEPERFYYDCDRLGMVVFQDMVNVGKYSFWRDSALPTAGFLRRDDKKLHTDPETRRNFLEAMEATAELLGNHPSICCWTIFNEGWGQFDADAAYDRLRALDDSRFIDAASGWFAQSRSDVESLHNYFRPLRLGRDRSRPQVISEYGGYVWKVPEHSFDPDRSYGYRKFRDGETFGTAMAGLLERLVPLAEQGLCAAILTQLSDVEDETNGLVTFDRRVRKLSPAKLAPIAEKLREAMNNIM